MSAPFEDGKDEGALRTIGEVSDALGIKQHVLRYWEQQFPMLKPLKRSGGRRYYRPGDVEMVEAIDRLVNREGYTLKGAKAAIREGKSGAARPPLAETPGVAIALAQGAAGDDVLAQLRGIRARLAAALDA
ncbi:MerR family transcriptional regulator [Altererythrobacter sp. BO-6]|uniref:MerR family transcriptional regulator n=1 Tax=Altererythrobacter sp. BO-6 TaxID=2604537 RepID=UPI0013E1D01A|nr:MerR family transcriptional regulator [Altererythrobacter sp. BO-6]QIG55035.1 MerR family transcriptional regulator [Altererythrobacter sp. BO-6]